MPIRSIEENAIADEGAEALALALKVNATLRIIGLGVHSKLNCKKFARTFCSFLVVRRTLPFGRKQRLNFRFSLILCFFF